MVTNLGPVCCRVKSLCTKTPRVERTKHVKYVEAQCPFRCGVNEERGRPAKKFEDAELQALLDEEDDQTQEHYEEQLNVDQSTVSRRLIAMGKVIKVGRWVPHELTDRQQENRKFECKMLLARYKRNSYLHRILSGNKKWNYFENPKRDQSLLHIYALLKPRETIITDRYKQQLFNLNDAILEKLEQYKKRQHKAIFLDDNAPSHRTKPTKGIVKVLGREPLAHSAYSPDLAPSDYHLFSSLGHALADQRFTSYENVKSWLDDWLASKDRSFFWRGIHKLPERWGNCVASDGSYFE
ncbi:mariner Mos1 transposase [Trichonephila clavipes]|nr:mariner Mos1 transposase [Trichonephila clavipes]